MNRRTFFKRIAVTCAAAVVTPTVLVRGQEEKHNITQHDGSWWKFPEYICDHATMVLGKSTSFFIDGDSHAWGVRCIKAGHAYTWQFTIHREEFRRNKPWQRRLLLDTRISNMLRDRREVTGEKYW